MKLNNKYYILRHGEALSNARGIVSSWPEKFDNHLTELGKNSIKEIEEKLEDKNINLIFASPLLRAQQTAEIIAKKIKIKIKTDKRLREIEFGIFNAKSVKDYEKYFEGQNRIKRKPSRGENYADVFKRMHSFLKQIDAKYKNKNILIVSHQCPLFLLEGMAKGFSLLEIVKNISENKMIAKGELRELN